MTDLTLVMGNKNYSSWSLRGWLAVKLTGAPFKEIVIPMARPETRQAMLEHSASGLVPVLHHGDVVVWDSLAIGEYLAELFPDSGLWPVDTKARATGRSIAAEMHAGFQAMRTHMPMIVGGRYPGCGDGPGVAKDIGRVTAIWESCRECFPDAGDFLVGPYCLADIMFAPVVSRFRTYGVELSPPCQTYAELMWQHPHMRDWAAAAEAELYTIEKYHPPGAGSGGG